MDGAGDGDRNHHKPQFYQTNDKWHMFFVGDLRIVSSQNHVVTRFIEARFGSSIRGTARSGAAVARRNEESDPSMCLNERIVSFDTWYAQQITSTTSPPSDKEGNLPTNVPTPLIDLRSATDRLKRRLNFPKDNNFSVVPFPIEHLKERSFELPGKESRVGCSAPDVRLSPASEDETNLISHGSIAICCTQPATWNFPSWCRPRNSQRRLPFC